MDQAAPSDDLPEFTDDELQAALERMAQAVRREAYAAGQPIVILRGAQFVWQFPDGHEECVAVADAATNQNASP